MIADPQKLCGFLAAPSLEVTNLFFASDDVVWVPWR